MLYDSIYMWYLERQIHRQTIVGTGAREGENEGLGLKGYEVSILGDEKFVSR